MLWSLAFLIYTAGRHHFFTFPPHRGHLPVFEKPPAPQQLLQYGSPHLAHFKARGVMPNVPPMFIFVPQLEQLTFSDISWPPNFRRAMQESQDDLSIQ
jgi:hypothetical protein